LRAVAPSLMCDTQPLERCFAFLVYRQTHRTQELSFKLANVQLTQAAGPRS
jgi:hypothetical protein